MPVCYEEAKTSLIPKHNAALLEYPREELMLRLGSLLIFARAEVHLLSD